MHKLGIIVPYRNRPEQLSKFRQSINDYITDIDFELIIVDQQGNNTIFPAAKNLILWWH